MFNPFVWLDGVLLGATQKFCDKVQRVTGLTKFRLEKWALIMTMIFYWATYFLVQDFSVLEPLLLIGTALSFCMVRIIEIEETEFLNNRNLETPILPMPFRIFMFFAVGFFAVGELSTINGSNTLICGYISYILWGYFNACIPRPPSKSKMREWSEKALIWLNDRLATLPVPAPNQ